MATRKRKPRKKPKTSPLAKRAKAPRHYRHWKLTEDRRLLKLWGEDPLTSIAKKLQRTPLQTYLRGRKLGLPCGCPQGYEYLSAAAKRCGYSTLQLRRVLEAGGVSLRTAFSHPTGSHRHYHVVIPHDVDEALAKMNGTEVVHTAARARGTDGETLRRWLIAAGHNPPKPPRRRTRKGAPPAPTKKLRWRVPTAIIDEVVKVRRSCSSVTAHAKRLGTTRQTLTVKLRRAGIVIGRGTKLPAFVVDEVLAIAPIRRGVFVKLVRAAALPTREAA